MFDNVELPGASSAVFSFLSFAFCLVRKLDVPALGAPFVCFMCVCVCVQQWSLFFCFFLWSTSSAVFFMVARTFPATAGAVFLLAYYAVGGGGGGLCCVFYAYLHTG